MKVIKISRFILKNSGNKNQTATLRIFEFPFPLSNFLSWLTDWYPSIPSLSGSPHS